MEREGRKVTVDASELEDGFEKVLALADEGVEVLITEHGKVTARIIPPDPGPKPRRSRGVRVEPRRRAGPRYVPPPPDFYVPRAVVDQIVRDWR